MRVILITGLLQLGFIVATACKQTVLCDPVKVFVKRVLTVLPFCIIDAAKLLCTSLKKIFCCGQERNKEFFFYFELWDQATIITLQNQNPVSVHIRQTSPSLVDIVRLFVCSCCNNSVNHTNQFWCKLVSGVSQINGLTFISKCLANAYSVFLKFEGC